MIGIIAAVSLNGVIGTYEGSDIWNIPWKYLEDMKHFKTTTEHSNIIMGKNTYASMGYKPLKNRRNFVISKTLNEESIPSHNFFINKTIEEALEISSYYSDYQNTWFIGGESIYHEALNYADKILLTIIPQNIRHKDPIMFPWINPLEFKQTNQVQLYDKENNPTLIVAEYYKI